MAFEGQKKNYTPKRSKCCSVSFQKLKHLHICLPPSSDEYEKEMSVLSVTSFYRQFGQLNCHLIIITKEQQKDKGRQKRFFWGPTSCHSNVPKGSVPSTHGFGRSMSTARAFQQDHDCVRFTTCATLPKITQTVTPQMYTVLPEQEPGRNNWKKMMNINNKKRLFKEVFPPGFRFGRFGFL